MLAKLKIALVLMAVLVFASCESIWDSNDDCGVYLEFIFDHNMKYADAFDPQVETVDVFIFDRSGKFVQTCHAATSDLYNRKRMFLGDSLTMGEYKVLTVGNLSQHFRFTELDGHTFVPGTTTIEQAVMALKHSGTVAHEFPHFYFGPVVEVENKTDMTVYRIPLIRQTNKFNIILQTKLKNALTNTIEGSTPPVHTVEVVAPEAGVYNWLNNPLVHETTCYQPYSLLSRFNYTESGVLRETAANLNTMRLLENEWNGYRIIVRNCSTGDELWSNDLLSLLAATKPARRPDGTDLPRAEYFDREGDWNIIIVYLSNDTPANPNGEGFVAVSVWINGWIVWQQNMDV